MKQPAMNFEITRHAAKRFSQRSGITDPVLLRESWDALWEKAEEVFLMPKFRIQSLLSHDFRESQYFHSGGWIFVVESGHVVTCHHGTANRWERKKDRPELSP